MHKVYCKNCKYYFNPFCPELRAFHYLTYGTKDMCNWYGSPKNKNHYCLKYRRKWWKFWIKTPKLSGKVKRPKPWPLPNISKVEIPPMPKCKNSKWIKGEKIKVCPKCEKGNLFFYWQEKYYHAQCDRCGYLYDTGRKMTSKEKKEKDE